MSRELRALRDHLATLGYPSHIGNSDSLPPYLVTWGPAGLRDSEESVGGSCGSYRVRGGITCTGQDAEAAGDLAAEVIELLNPQRSPAVLPNAEGRHMVIDLYDVRPAEVDTTWTLTSTNTHPAYAVVLFDLYSQPIPTEVSP